MIEPQTLFPLDDPEHELQLMPLELDEDLVDDLLAERIETHGEEVRWAS